MTQDQTSFKRSLLKHGLDLEGGPKNNLIWEAPAKIHHGVHLMEVELGAYSYLTAYSEINCATIGRYCSIGPYGRIFGSAHPTQWLTTHPFTHNNIFGDFVPYEPKLHFPAYEAFTRIGHDVWTGTNVIILPGTKIGNGAVIGAGAVVAKDVPDYAIVVGNPGKVIKYRFNEKLIQRLLKTQWWRFDMPRILAAQPDLPFDKPEAMLDYIEKHEESLPKLSGIRKLMLERPEGVVVRTLQPSEA